MSTRSGPVPYRGNTSDAPVHTRVTGTIIVTPQTPRNEKSLFVRGRFALKKSHGSVLPRGCEEPAGDAPPRASRCSTRRIRIVLNLPILSNLPGNCYIFLHLKARASPPRRDLGIRFRASMVSCKVFGKWDFYPKLCLNPGSGLRSRPTIGMGFGIPFANAEMTSRLLFYNTTTHCRVMVSVRRVALEFAVPPSE